MYPVKNVKINNKKYKVYGLQADDQYFAYIHDGFETDFALICENVLNSHSVVMDIGANIGVTSLILSDYVPQGKVVAVEAGTTIAEICKKNIAENHRNNIILENVVMGDKEGFAYFSENSAFGHIELNDEHELSATVQKLPMTTLSHLINKHALGKLDLIKLDIEGNEMPVLVNTLDIINDFGSLVYFEFNSWCLMSYGDTNPRNFVDWIFDNFSHVYLVDKHASPDKMLIPILDKQNVDSRYSFLYWNVVKDAFVSDFLVTNNNKWVDTLSKFTSASSDISLENYGDLIAKRGDFHSQHESLLNSVSWKLTTGLRKLKSIFKAR